MAGKRPAERPQFRWLRSRTFWFFRRGPQKGLFGPFSGPRGPWVNFFSEYRQVGYPERRNDMPWSYSIVSVHIEQSSKRKWPKTFFLGPHFFRHPVALLVIVAFPVIVALPVMYGMVSYDILWLHCMVLHAFTMLASARRLCLARRLYTSWWWRLWWWSASWSASSPAIAGSFPPNARVHLRPSGSCSVRPEQEHLGCKLIRLIR